MNCVNCCKFIPDYDTYYVEPSKLKRRKSARPVYPIQCKHHLLSIVSKSDCSEKPVPFTPCSNFDFSEVQVFPDLNSFICHDQAINQDNFFSNGQQINKRNHHRNNYSARCFSSQLVVPVMEQRPSYHDDLVKRGLLVKGSLGAGSYSKVKKAVDAHSNFAEVAIKIIDRCHATKDYLDRFLPRELSIWIRLSHPNLIKLIDFFEENMRVYMVTEYAPGGDALNYIQKKGPLNETQAKNWFNQISSALSYMHSRNVAHRDLKLENLLLFEGCNRIKLGDFGFVKNIQPNNCLSDTFCGSKAYAAPEILSGQAYDPKKGDVWALGVVLFIIVTGKMPFNETRGIKNVLEEQAALNLGELNACFEKVILRAFTWNVAMRPDIDSLQLDPWTDE